MKLFLVSAYNVHNALDQLREAASLDTSGAHGICDNPESADLILFVEDAQFDDYLYSTVSKHPLVAKFPHKCRIYNEVDHPWAVLPGLYCAMPKWSFDASRQRAFQYTSTPNQLVRTIYADPDDEGRPYLFSYVGTGCIAMRRRMIKIASQLEGKVVDTSGFNVWDCTEEERQAQGQVFARTMRLSNFVLCPRGLGVASYRLYETMEAGRAPVIITDHWVAPAHTDWSFALRLPERDLPKLGDLLRSHADEARDRGEAARKAWEENFAPATLFKSVGEELAALELTLGTQSNRRLAMLRKNQVRVISSLASGANKLRQIKRQFIR
ncbi:MAG: exostosin domain-containing protein [Granulosicoccaceae bacterium]